MPNLRSAGPGFLVALAFALGTSPGLAQEAPTAEVTASFDGEPGGAAWIAGSGFLPSDMADGHAFPSDVSWTGKAARSPGSRSPGLAAGLEFLFPVPTLGYAYAGDWRRGLLPGGVQVVGASLIVAGITETVIDGLSGDTDADCGSLCAVGITMLIGGRIWSTVGAARAAGRWNLDRGGSLAVQWVPGPSGGGVWVAYRF